MRALTPLRYSLLALGLVLSLACSADEPNSPTAPPANPVPVPTPVQVNFTVTASRGELVVNGTNPSIVTIRAVRADTGQPVTGVVNVTTTLGGLGSVGGPQAVELTLVGGVATVPFFPGGTIGTASISASLPGVGTRFVNINVREEILETFFITSISPGTGSPQGGEIVTIFGGGISGPLRVTFGNLPAEVLSSTATQIRVRTPPCSFDGSNGCFGSGASTPVAVSVTVNLNEEDEASDSLANGFVYQGTGGGGNLQPVIFSVTPSSGPNQGGTQVIINGDGFEAPVQVSFGTGTAAANFNGADAQVISVTRTRVVVIAPATNCVGCAPAPPEANQLANIMVKNLATGRATVAVNAFRYGTDIFISSMGPGVGPVEGGQQVTIFGGGFDSPVAVEFTGAPQCGAQQVVSVSGSEIVILTVGVSPTSCADVVCTAVQVTNIESGATAIESLGYRYDLPQPVAFSVSPNNGSQGGGTVVTITGQNFQGPFTVRFGEFTGSVGAITPTTVSATSPPFPDAIFGAGTPCDDDADLTLGHRFGPVSVDVTLTNPVNGCTSTLAGAFRVNPSNTGCQGD